VNINNCSWFIYTTLNYIYLYFYNIYVLVCFLSLFFYLPGIDWEQNKKKKIFRCYCLRIHIIRNFISSSFIFGAVLFYFRLEIPKILNFFFALFLSYNQSKIEMYSLMSQIQLTRTFIIVSHVQKKQQLTILKFNHST